MRPFICAITLWFGQVEDRPLDPLDYLEADPSGLKLTVTPFQPNVVEYAPLVMRIRLENTGPTPINTFFKDGSGMRSFGLFKLRAVEPGDSQHQLEPLVTLIPNVGRAAGIPLAPGTVLETEHLMCLHSIRDRKDPRKQGDYYLSPGKYQVKGVLISPHEIESDPFELTVLKATGDDAEALELLPLLPYYAQGAARFPGPNTKRAEGGSPDEVRAALTRIQNELPGSVFAKWTRYWQAYHSFESHQGVEPREAIRQALAFADRHPDFPLTDNLLSRTVDQTRRVGELGEARKLLKRLRDNYPDTDLSEGDLKKLESAIAEDEVRASRPPGEQ